MSWFKQGDVVPLGEVQWTRRRFCQGVATGVTTAALGQLGGCDGGAGGALPYVAGPLDLMSPEDFSRPGDHGGSPDLGGGPDFADDRDFAQTTDLAQDPDLAMQQGDLAMQQGDLSSPPSDLAQRADLAQNPDLRPPPDLAQNPDLRPPPDFAQNPDLRPPPDLVQSCPGYTSTGRVPGQFAVNTATYFVIGNAFVCRDGGGMFALTAICTHMGCVVNPLNGGANGFQCPCHFSTFNLNGAVTMGPAFQPLVHFPLCLDGNGQVTYNPNAVVASNLRYPF